MRKFMLICLLFSWLSHGFTTASYNTQLTTSTCAMVVTTDDGRAVDVWLDGHIVGKTPLCISDLQPGVYDVSFMNPRVRDSILNSGTSVNEINEKYHSATMVNGRLRLGSPMNTAGAEMELFQASGEMARTSCRKVRVIKDEPYLLTFAIGDAEKLTAKKNRHAKTKIILIWTLLPLSIAFIVLGIFVNLR